MSPPCPRGDGPMPVPPSPNLDGPPAYTARNACPTGAQGGTMTTQLLVFGVLGILTTAYAFWVNRRLFGADGAGRITVLEGAYYFFGVVGVCIGWYFNVRYTHHVGSKANYVTYT